MLTLKVGQNEYIENDIYHADKYFLTSSILKKFYTGDIYAGDEIYSDKVKLNFSTGNYIHSLLLEPQMIEDKYAVYDKYQRGKEYQIFLSKNKNKTVIKTADKVLGEKVQKNLPKLVGSILSKEGEVEQTFCHTLMHKNKKIPVKIRPDYIFNKDMPYIVDLKTTSADLCTEDIKKCIQDFNYDLSVALYTRVFTELYKKEITFYFLFINKINALSRFFSCSPSLIEKGNKKLNIALDNFIKYSETNTNGFETITPLVV